MWNKKQAVARIRNPGEKITESKNAPGVKAVVNQLKRRFRDLQSQEHVGMERILGVGCDGDTIVFVRMRGAKLDAEDPQPVTPYTVQRLLRALVSLGRTRAFLHAREPGRPLRFRGHKRPKWCPAHSCPYP